MMPDRLYEALQYRRLGYHPIPFYPHSKTPAFEAGAIRQYRIKVPTDRELLEMFRDPERNIGLITGANNLHIIDVDGDEGRASLKRLPPLPRTPTLITSRGAQYYFQGNETLPTKLGIMPGIDFLSSGHQALTASSVHPDGPVYHFADGLSLVEVERALVPAWIFELLPQDLRNLGAIASQALDTTTHDTDHHPLYRGVDNNRGHRIKEPRYLSSGAPVLLDTNPQLSICNREDVQTLYGDFEANQWVAGYLGLARLGSTFLCLFHPDRHASMSLYVDQHTGAWKVHDWHERGDHGHYGLADIFASRIIGQEVRLEGSPTLTVWWLRLLITSGYIAPAAVPMKPLPLKVKPVIRTLYDGFILNFQGRWLYDRGQPMPYTEAFAMGWCGLKSKRAVAEGLSWLKRHGYMRAAGRSHGSQVFLPGEGA